MSSLFFFNNFQKPSAHVIRSGMPLFHCVLVFYYTCEWKKISTSTLLNFYKAADMLIKCWSDRHSVLIYRIKSCTVKNFISQSTKVKVIALKNDTRVIVTLTWPSDCRYFLTWNWTLKTTWYVVSTSPFHEPQTRTFLHLLHEKFSERVGHSIYRCQTFFLQI